MSYRATRVLRTDGSVYVPPTSTVPTASDPYKVVRDTPGNSVSLGSSKVSNPVAVNLATQVKGDYDGQDGLIRVGTDPDQHEEYFTWNASLNRWIGREMVTMSMDDAWATDLTRQPSSLWNNGWARFNGGVGWYRNGPRAFLRITTTLPSGTLSISTNEESDAGGWATSGQALVRDQLITYTGYVATPGARQLTGCTGGTGTLPANYTTVIPYGSAAGGDYGGWGCTVNPIDRVSDLWNLGFRLKERARAWMNGSADNFAMTIAPYYINRDLTDDFNYPTMSNAPSGELGFGLSLVGPASPVAWAGPTRIDERGFQQVSANWTTFPLTPTKRILVPILYGKMAAGAQDTGEVYGYTLTHRWELQL